MNAGHQLVAFIILLQAIYFLNRQRKPYFFGFTAKSVLVKNQLGKGALIGFYLFITIAALIVVVQDLYQLIADMGNHLL